MQCYRFHSMRRFICDNKLDGHTVTSMEISATQKWNWKPESLLKLWVVFQFAEEVFARQLDLLELGCNAADG